MNKKDQSNASKETNIQVVVRCRPKSIKERTELSVIECDKKEVRVGHPINKNFSFDRVFGTDSHQDEVYNEVVAPLIHEVMAGYNCTIFAYGQTGTGKTYTMEGSRWDEISSFELNKDAGIIPRSIHHLFQILESQESDFTVHVSQIELYNEELNDLLSTEEDTKRLRIFDDQKGGCMIQGIVEDLVENAPDVIKIMQRGSNKRQVAETKMNAKSSRSHCVFSITIRIKEYTPDGEELLKIGKLNLVDLAGSENIGRSGAVDSRAREAGKINQSLLTLGRVINALVDHSPHIPYRESKLTRLLQDSLGGKTKTCIIATVAPTKNNLEETLSTLDYAHRAKNIRNRPEVNQKMSKKSLIKDYLSEIERLKRDLSASQAKNGIYLSPEHHQEIQDQIKLQTQLIEEKTALLQQLEASLATTKSEFDTTKKDLHQTKGQLSETQNTLSKREDELQKTRQSLSEQKTITEELEKTEIHLHDVASKLLETVNTTVSDVDGLHKKIDRKRKLDETNYSVIQQFTTSIKNQAIDSSESFSSTHSSTHSITDSINMNVKSFTEQHLQDLSNTGSNVNRMCSSVLIGMTEMSKQIMNQSTSMKRVLSSLSMLNKEAVPQIQEIFNSIEVEYNQGMNDINTQLESQLRLIRTWQERINTQLHTMSCSIESFSQFQSQEIKDLEDIFAKQADYRKERSKEMDNQMKILIQQQQQSLTNLQNETLDQMTRLVTQLVSEQKESLNKLSNTYATQTQTSETTLISYEDKYSEATKLVLSSINKFSSDYSRANKLVKLDVSSEEVEKQIVKSKEFIQESKLLSSSRVAQSSTQCTSFLNANKENIDKVIEEDIQMEEQLQHNLNNLSSNLNEQNLSISQEVDRISQESSTFKSKLDELVLNANSSINTMEQTHSSFVNEVVSQTSSLPDSITWDILTHETPMKKSYEFPKNWRRTKSYETILSESRASLDQLDSSIAVSDLSFQSKENLPIENEMATPVKKKTIQSQSLNTSKTPRRNKLPLLSINKNHSNEMI